MTKPKHTLEGVKASVLGVALTNKMAGSDSYNSYLSNLDKQLTENSETRTQEPIPFYKEGVASPAGYVIETDRQVMVCYHGTQFGKIMGSGGTEIKHDLQMGKEGMQFGDKNLKVHRGFKAEYESSKGSLFEALKQVNPDQEVNVAGHSLGGAASQIFALDVATNHPKIKIGAVHTYGSPRVMSIEAAQEYNAVGLGDKTLRIKQKADPVPRLAPKRAGYAHVGDKISVKAGEKSVHSGSVYRKIGMKGLKKEDISGARKADEPLPIETYCSAVKRMTSEAFNTALNSAKKMSASVSQAISETKDVMASKVKEMVTGMMKGFMQKSSSGKAYNAVPQSQGKIEDKGRSR